MRPFDLTVTHEELQKAQSWWRNLSINQMKSYKGKYFPNTDLHSLTPRWIHQIWEDENKPEPQPTIPA